ncbi:MAG: energy-coupling factor transporter transmembrane component T [Streptomycetales bacterium]
MTRAWPAQLFLVRGRPPRALHPGAWWLWSLGLAAAASRTTNPLLLLLTVAVTGYTVAHRRTDSPWARCYAAFLTLGVAVIAIRVVFGALFGAPIPGRTLIDLPEVPLPDWAAGVRIGGPVTAEGLAMAAYDGLRLATMLVCLGAANALASPHRLLRCLPAALYEVGVAAVVAMTLAPQLVAHVSRVRAARRLRGRPDRGIRGLRGVAMPVLEQSLERALELAAAMDARGYGRTAGVPLGVRRLTAGLVLGGLLGICIGVYGLLDAGSPALFGLPLLAAGAVLAVGGFALSGRRSPRTRYRPDRWSAPEWVVGASGCAAAAVLIAAEAYAPTGLAPRTVPLQAPTLPVLPAIGILAGLLPAWAAPRPSEAAR